MIKSAQAAGTKRNMPTGILAITLSVFKLLENELIQRSGGGKRWR
jgi:hypothetical protein